MKSGIMDRKARVWTVTLGPNGELRAEIDPQRARKFRP
jgi:hypothetical protein